MTLKASIEAFAAQLSGGTPGDPKHVVDVRDHLLQVKEHLQDDELTAAQEACDDALECIGSLLWQESNDPSGDYTYLEALVPYLRAVLDAFERGVSPEVEPPSRDTAGAGSAEPMDLELLGMFLSSCEENLETIEGLALKIEEGCDEESLGHLRRVVHTIKGEFGVLSLEEAQRLFHEAEDQLDRSLEAGGTFPAEAVLMLGDWLKEYTQRLSEDSAAAPPPSAPVLEAFQAPAAGAGTPRAQEAEQAPEQPETPPMASAAAPAQSTTPKQDPAGARFLPDSADADPVGFDPDVFDDPMMGDVQSESRGHLEDAEAALLELEDDPSQEQTVDRIFRAFHTIKGVAGFMNLTPVVEVAHWSETLLDDFRKGYQACTVDHVNLVLRSRDTMSQLFDSLAGGTTPTVGSIRILLDELQAATVGAGGAAPAKPAPAPTPAEEPTAQAPAAESAPKAEGEASQPAPPGDVPRPESASKPAEKPAAKDGPAPVKKAPQRQSPKLEHAVKVGTKRLDQLVDMVGELVIAQQMVTQDSDVESLRSERLNRNLTQVAKITRDLQESAMSLRMVPLRSTFQKMARLVRDVSRKAGRTVSLEIAGEDTELDRTVVEEIGDPLIHLIRNAVDHGLEPPAERQAQGKAVEGILHLGAYHQGGSIVIEIRDDGRGLDRQKLLDKANERGLLPPGVNGEEMSDTDVFKLIFAPGFSTAAKVTDISGRGVGMDVVRRNIEALRGKIDITSKLGEGTTFYLRLPLTLAIIDGMIVRVGSSRYVLPTLSIEQSFRPHQDQLHSVLSEGRTVQVRDNLLTVRSLRDMFGLLDGTDDPTEGILIILEAHGERTCVLVDEILYQQQVVIKSIGKAVPSVQGISGAAILGDGTVALILDVDGLLEQASAPAPAILGPSASS